MVSFATIRERAERRKGGADARQRPAQIEGAADRCKDGHGVIPCGLGAGGLSGAGYWHIPDMATCRRGSLAMIEETPWRTAATRPGCRRGPFR